MVFKKNNGCSALSPAKLSGSVNKKGQGLSINVIIIGVIALVILMIIIAIVTGSLGDFIDGTKKGHLDCSGPEASSSDAVLDFDESDPNSYCKSRHVVREEECKGYDPVDDSTPGEFRCLASIS